MKNNNFSQRMENPIRGEPLVVEVDAVAIADSEYQSKFVQK